MNITKLREEEKQEQKSRDVKAKAEFLENGSIKITIKNLPVNPLSKESKSKLKLIFRYLRREHRIKMIQQSGIEFENLGIKKKKAGGTVEQYVNIIRKAENNILWKNYNYKRLCHFHNIIAEEDSLLLIYNNAS